MVNLMVIKIVLAVYKIFYPYIIIIFLIRVYKIFLISG